MIAYIFAKEPYLMQLSKNNFEVFINESMFISPFANFCIRGKNENAFVYE
jgi:hypothetical protein